MPPLKNLPKNSKNMNEKQTIPVIATLAPLVLPVAIGCGIFFALKWLLSDEDKKNKPETTPANAETESRRKVAEIAAFRKIPAEISVKPVAVPVSSAPRVIVPPPTVPYVPNFPSPAAAPAIVPLTKDMAQAPPPPPIKKKFVTREDMANIFNHGTRTLTRKDAVSTLLRLGFGKTAAYRALSPDGRFASWLQFAPDGIITWNN